METGRSVSVVEAGFGNKNRLRVKYGGLEEVRQDSVIFGVSLDGETMEGELQISGGKSEGHPGVVADGEGLIELVGESIKEGGVGSGGTEVSVRLGKLHGCR